MLAEATIMADAIASGERVDQVSATVEAADGDAACAYAFAAMRIDDSLGACESDKSEAQLGLSISMPAFDVSIILSPTLDPETLQEALKRLAAAGISTITTELNPVKGLEAVVPEGVIDETLLETFEREAAGELDDKVRRVSDFTTALENAAEEAERFEELSDLAQCQARCAAQSHCCNSDIAQGSNQQLSCLQACMVVKSGVAEEECLAYCPFKSCSRWIRGVHYEACAFCDDVPAHAGQFAADEIVTTPYECSSRAGASPQTCEDGCRAGAATDPIVAAPKSVAAEIVAAPGPPAGARAASGTAPGTEPGTEPGETTGEAPIRAEDAGGPLRGCSPEEMADARARDGDHYVTLRFGVSVPAAVRAETIHAIKANATLDDVSRALERDEAFASAWPGRLARRDFKPVEGSEAVVDKGAESRAFADASSRSAERLEGVTESSREVRPDGREAADAIAAAEAALEARRAEALRLAAEVEGDMRTSSSGRYWQRAAALGAAAGGGGGSAETGSGWSFAAAGAAVTAVAAAAVAASRAARDRGNAAERVPLTGVGATATVF